MIFQHTDVTQIDAWRTVVDLALAKFNKLDILVNNAGTTYRNKVRSSEIQTINGAMLTSQPTAEVTEAEWERVFQVNVKSIYLAAAVVIPKLIEGGNGGSVINISSTGASRPRPGLVWYNASKGAVTNVSGIEKNLISEARLYTNIR